MLLTKYLQPFEGVWYFWKKLMANLGVRCYLHIFSYILEGVRCYSKIIEGVMYFLVVIEVFSPQSLIRWSSQHCSSYHQFDFYMI